MTLREPFIGMKYLKTIEISLLKIKKGFDFTPYLYFGNYKFEIQWKAVIVRSDITAKKIKIGHCGYLTVQDGLDINFRAMHIDVHDGGILKIGSETCRHKSNLDIELYGTRAEQLQNDETLDK